MAIISAVWGAVSSLGLVKVAAKFIGSKADWVMANWKLVIMGVEAVAIVALLLYHAFSVVGLNAQLNDMENAKISAEGKLYVLNGTLERTDQALNVCREINAANAMAYVEMANRVDLAEKRARESARAAETQVEVINGEASELRGRDEDCRALDDPLPDWFDEWLRND